MNNKVLFFAIGALLFALSLDAFGQTFGTEFVSRATPVAKQAWIIVKWICGLAIGSSVLVAGYKITQKGNNDVKIELILILVFIGIYFITPTIIEWIAGVRIN